MQSTAGAAETAAPAALSFREPTFGDWMEIGDIARQVVVNPRDVGGDVALEQKPSPYAVGQWFAALSGQSQAVLRTLPMSAGIAAYRDLSDKLPPFEDAVPDGSAVAVGDKMELKLNNPLPGARGQVATVMLGQPSIGDWLDCGNVHVRRVVNPEADGQPKYLEIKLDEAAVTRWMARMTGLAEPILGLMSYTDARRVFAYVKQSFAGLELGN